MKYGVIEKDTKLEDYQQVNAIFYASPIGLRMIADRMEQSNPGEDDIPIIIGRHKHENKWRLTITSPGKEVEFTDFIKEAEATFK